jgi:hypothetical protein
MDPNSIANLDPKLRETYERVMGATTPAATAGSANPPILSQADTSAATQTSVNPEAPAVASAETLSSQLSPALPPQPTPQPSGTPPATNTFQAEPTPQPFASPAAINQAAQGQETSSLVRLLYVFGALLFFIVYVFFWIKVFNYKLPF